jgi:hypothetical protein
LHHIVRQNLCLDLRSEELARCTKDLLVYQKNVDTPMSNLTLIEKNETHKNSDQKDGLGSFGLRKFIDR